MNEYRIIGLRNQAGEHIGIARADNWYSQRLALDTNYIEATIVDGHQVGSRIKFHKSHIDPLCLTETLILDTDMYHEIVDPN